MGFESKDQKLARPENKEKVQTIGFQLMDIFNEEDLEVLAQSIKFMSPSTKKRFDMAIELAKK